MAFLANTTTTFTTTTAATATAASGWWDVKVDWDLCSTTPKKKGDYNYPFLRGRLLFRRHIWFYYVAIILDLVLRFLWTLTLLPSATTGPLQYFQYRYKHFLPGVELLRRSMFSWLRFEKEQICKDDEMYQDREMHYLYPSKDGQHHQESDYLPAFFSRTHAELCLRLDIIKDKIGRLMVSYRKRKSVDGGRLEDEDGDDIAGTNGPRGEHLLVPSISSFLIDRDHEVEVDGALHIEEDDDDDDSQEEALESQRAMQRRAASRRTALMEASIVIMAFIILAVLATQHWIE